MLVDFSFIVIISMTINAIGAGGATEGTTLA